MDGVGDSVLQGGGCTYCPIVIGTSLHGTVSRLLARASRHELLPLGMQGRAVCQVAVTRAKEKKTKKHLL